MRILFLILIVCLSFSCRNKNKIPAGILSQTKMKEVMWDILRADEMILNISVKDSSANTELKRVELYSRIFDIHHITKEKFQKSLSFYKSRPDLFKQVMDSLQSYDRRASEQTLRQPRPFRDTAVPKRPVPFQK